MQLEKRQDDSVAQISSTEVRDDGIIISAMTDMGSYGKVRFTINIESSGDRSAGIAYGAGRGALSDGTFLGGSFNGRWTREGTLLVVHAIDHVSNGDINFLKFEFDATENEITLVNYAVN
jgi:hypothetical protein